MNFYDHAAGFVGLVALGTLGYAFIDPLVGFTLTALLILPLHWLGRRGTLDRNANPKS